MTKIVSRGEGSCLKIEIKNCPDLELSFGNRKHWASQASPDMLSRSSQGPPSATGQTSRGIAANPWWSSMAKTNFVGDAWGYPLVGDECWRAEAARCRKHQRCERGHLYALFVDAPFAQLMTVIHLCSGLGGIVRVRAWVENPDFEECALECSAPESAGFDVKPSFGSRLALVCKNSSPLRGCSFGSTTTSAQISFSRLAVRSRISLCRVMVNPPLLQVKAWQLLKDSPQAQCEGRPSGSNP